MSELDERKAGVGPSGSPEIACSGPTALDPVSTLEFEVELVPPDLAPWLPGNCGLAGFWQFHAEQPGPHVAVIALMHGNEIAGAIALDAMLRTQPCPVRGMLTLGFANLEAFHRFDPANAHECSLSFPNSVVLYLTQIIPNLYIGRSGRRYARGMSRGLA